MGIELDVCERECEDERFDCLVFLLLEPRFCDNADVRFQRGKRRAIEQRRGLIYGPVDFDRWAIWRKAVRGDSDVGATWRCDDNTVKYSSNSSLLSIGLV